MSAMWFIEQTVPIFTIFIMKIFVEDVAQKLFDIKVLECRVYMGVGTWQN